MYPTEPSAALVEHCLKSEFCTSGTGMRELNVKLAKIDHQLVIDMLHYKLQNSMEPPGYDPNRKLT